MGLCLNILRQFIIPSYSGPDAAAIFLMLGIETAQTLAHVITMRDGISTFIQQRKAQSGEWTKSSFHCLPVVLPFNWNPHIRIFTDADRDTRQQIYLKLRGENGSEIPVQELGRFEIAAQAEADATNMDQVMPADKSEQNSVPNSPHDSALNAAMANAMANANAPPTKNNSDMIGSPLNYRAPHSHHQAQRKNWK